MAKSQQEARMEVAVPDVFVPNEINPAVASNFFAVHPESASGFAESIFDSLQNRPPFEAGQELARTLYQEALNILVKAERQALEKTKLNPGKGEFYPQAVFSNIVASRRALQSFDEANLTGAGSWLERLETARKGDAALWPETSGLKAQEIGEAHIIADRIGVLDFSLSFGPYLYIYDANHPAGRYVLDAITDVTSRGLGMNAPELDADAVFTARRARATLQSRANSDFWNQSAAEMMRTVWGEGVMGPEYPYFFRAESGTQAVEAALVYAQDTKKRLLLMGRMAQEAGFPKREDFADFARGKLELYENLKQQAKAGKQKMADLLEERSDSHERLALQYLHAAETHSFEQQLLKHYDLNKSDYGQEVIFFSGGFHGRTAAAKTGVRGSARVKYEGLPAVPWVKRITYSWDLDNSQGAELRKKIFAGKLTPVERKAIEDQMVETLEAYLKTNHEKVALVGIEPIQGEGGYRLNSPEFLQRLQDTAHKYDVFFLLDEIQTGMGRASAGAEVDGKPTWFLSQKYGLKPDLITGGKIFGEGVVFGRQESFDRAIFHAFNKVAGRTNSTFGGSTAGATQLAAAIPVMKEWLPHAQEMGQLFLTGMRNIEQEWDSQLVSTGTKLIGDVRGEGTMLAFDLPSPEVRALVHDKMVEKGLLTLTTGSNGIRFLFPFDTPKTAVEEMLEIVKQSLIEVMETKPDLSVRYDLPALDHVIAIFDKGIEEAKNVIDR